VQKKVIPWRLMAPDSQAEQEYSYRKKGGKPDGLILVTSLINKIPNLGGEKIKCTQSKNLYCKDDPL
jgi:hypothetical protein